MPDTSTEQKLTIEDGKEIYKSFKYRRDTFTDEDEFTSLMVVLFNYGDKKTSVRCIGSEWSGIKKDLQRQEGLPKCPNGHPLLESASERYTLGFIPDPLEIPK